MREASYGVSQTSVPFGGGWLLAPPLMPSASQRDGITDERSAAAVTRPVTRRHVWTYCLGFAGTVGVANAPISVPRSTTSYPDGTWNRESGCGSNLKLLNSETIFPSSLVSSCLSVMPFSFQIQYLVPFVQNEATLRVQ